MVLEYSSESIQEEEDDEGLLLQQMLYLQKSPEMAG